MSAEHGFSPQQPFKALIKHFYVAMGTTEAKLVSLMFVCLCIAMSAWFGECDPIVSACSPHYWSSCPLYN